MALATVGLARSAAAPTGKPGNTSLFRFLQWNDVHVDETQPPGYRLANEKMKYLVEWANASERLPRSDFAVGIGDMIHGGSLDSLSPDIRLQKRLLGDLRIPFYPVIGNHENVQREGDPRFEAPFHEAFGDDRTNYVFKHKGLLFVMLNNSGAPSSNAGDVGRRRREWLQGVLGASDDRDTIICCHIPLVPLRDESVLAKSFGFDSYMAKDEELLRVVDRHAGSILAVLSGHLHLTGVVVCKGVHHVSISGTASYPCDFASYDVFRDRIRLCVHSVPQELLTPETDIHGRRRHGIDYTDSTHLTHESYLKGNPSERVLDIIRASASATRPAGTIKESTNMETNQ